MGSDGTSASCFHKHLSCKGLKYCSARSLPSSQLPSFKLDSLAEAKKEIFLKTLAFYCTLAEKGCAFDLGRDGEDIGSTELTDNALHPTSDSESDSHSESESETRTNIPRDSRRKKTSNLSCKGKLELRLDEYGRVFVQCEHRKKNDRAHLILRTLDEFNISYLRALLENDSQTITEFEELARQSGYGPLVPCVFSAPPSARKDLCPYWHHQSGKLARGVLQRERGNSRRRDTAKTRARLGIYEELPPRLGWNKPFDPSLSALHPSLGNLDHVRRYIDELRHVLFPEGTGFEGAQLLAAQHQKLPEGEQYVRCAEKHTLEDGTIFYLVISFKRLSGKWQEFEMETWELDRMKSVIGTRAFTASQSAEAHLILFTRIFEIAFEDTGVSCRFRHIHGEGFELWITDAHKGQALGVGQFCQKLCAELGDVYCPLEPTRLLRTLDPYDHLRRCLRFCTTHNKHNIHKLKPYTTQKVRNAILSLSSSQVHPDLDGAFRIVENGGRRAKAWLKDKQVGSKFALPALYQPASLIPLEIWKSAPSTMNGNEQAHRNINRDGVNLTMLGAIMRVLVQTRIVEALENEDNAAGPSQSDSAVAGNLLSGQHASAARVNEAPLFTTTPLAPALHFPTLHQSSWLDEETQFVVPEVPMQVDIPSTLFQPSADGTMPDSFHSIHSQLHTHTSSSAAPSHENFSQDSLDRYLATYGLPTYSFDPHILLDETSYMHDPEPSYDLPPHPVSPRTPPLAHIAFEAQPAAVAHQITVLEPINTRMHLALRTYPSEY
ncbi:hypothetical protein MVEN_02332800 [Mycena venus]|uniref:Uncharacterized protein n=1 Tax=Mycena venus TaxID=2733690 RepID=A0A8H7CER4_9AGAR|nr:hypothetical protein MVEN_02332800 [Mycena venus]